MFPVLPKRPRGAGPLAEVDAAKRLSKRHRAAIERLQPHRTDRWEHHDTRIHLRLLRDLNRFDKHRQLNVIAVARWADAVDAFPRPAGLAMKSTRSEPLVSGALVAELTSSEDFRDTPVGHLVLSNMVFDELDGKPEAVLLMHQMTGAVERIFERSGATSPGSRRPRGSACAVVRSRQRLERSADEAGARIRRSLVQSRGAA